MRSFHKSVLNLARWLGVAAATGVAYAAGFIVNDVLEEDVSRADAVVAQLHSTILGEERQYSVYLPEGYDPDAVQRYPVLYVLDGPSRANPAAETAALMARIGVIPPMLVVGVGVDGNTRIRDYTPPGMLTDVEDPASPPGAGDNFLAFLRDELLPAIDRDYRTDGTRMLAGWSRSALFVVYSQIAEPALFTARFAHSPALWRENDLILARLKDAFVQQPALPGFLFLSLGDGENPKMTTAFEHAVDLLEQAAPPSLHWESYVSTGGDHESNPRLSTPVGLAALYRWKPGSGGVPGETGIQ